MSAIDRAAAIARDPSTAPRIRLLALAWIKRASSVLDRTVVGGPSHPQPGGHGAGCASSSVHETSRVRTAGLARLTERRGRAHTGAARDTAEPGPEAATTAQAGEVAGVGEPDPLKSSSSARASGPAPAAVRGPTRYRHASA